MGRVPPLARGPSDPYHCHRGRVRQEIGRPLSGDEISAHTAEFKRHFAKLAAPTVSEQDDAWDCDREDAYYQPGHDTALLAHLRS